MQQDRPRVKLGHYRGFHRETLRPDLNEKARGRGARAHIEQLLTLPCQRLPFAARMLGGELHQVARYASGVVAGCASLFQIIAKHRNYTQRLDGVQIGDDLGGAFESVLRLHLVGDWRSVDERVVEQLALRVAIESADVIGGG